MQTGSVKPAKLKVKRGISYGRVSTFEQAYHRDGNRREDASPEAQRSRCNDHVLFLSSKNRANYQILEHISDEGFSGKNTNRPGYQRMLDLIAIGNVDFVVATELSRISRSVVDFLELVAHCEVHNVDLLIIGLDLDTSNPFGRIIVIILVALAQFEREMTSQRVKENALNRLLKDGKINGAAEILGLDRDLTRPGHFLLNEEELLKVEKLLKIFLKFSSKKKALAEAQRLGLTGKKGRALTRHALDTIFENVRWRYRGLWYANKDNEGKDPEELPENKRFQIVELPHGPLIDQDLLKKVEEKLADTYAKKKREGKENRVYLLSHLLEYEDGSKYYGGPAKGRSQYYYYYYSKGGGPNLKCSEIEEVVIDRIKSYFKGNEIFNRLVANAVKKRITEVPKIDHQIIFLKRELEELEDENQDLLKRLRSKEHRKSQVFMDWLETEVEKLSAKRTRKEQELSAVYASRDDLIKKSGLENLQKASAEFIARFDELSGVEKRNFIERMIQKIVVKQDNKIELHVLWDPKKGVTRTTNGSFSDRNGGVDGTRTRGLRRDRPAL
jgi:DNA invertase Pin-like site-specific DNA recombinase